jgi:hypothetical protein
MRREEPEECGGRKIEDGGWKKWRLRSSLFSPHSLPSLLARVGLSEAMKWTAPDLLDTFLSGKC